MMPRLSSWRSLLLVVAVVVLVGYMLINTIMKQQDIIPDQSSVFPILPSFFTTAEKDSNPPFTWSACMIVRDENIALPEWLAYHMQVLPLKRIIIGQDPAAKTHPGYILLHFERELGLEWTVLEYDDYFVPAKRRRNGNTTKNRDHRQYNFSYERLANGTIALVTDKEALYLSHLWRQNKFLEKCLSMLRDEGRTWTIVLDADEFLVYNPYKPQEESPSTCMSKKRRSACLLDFHARMQGPEQGVHMRTRVPATDSNGNLYYPHNNRSTEVSLTMPPTMAHYLSKHMKDLIEWKSDSALPCWGLTRMLFGASISNTTSVGSNQTSSIGYQSLDTLRFHHHNAQPQNQLAKCIVNLSAYSGKFDVSNPHRLLPKALCRHSPWSLDEDTVFRVHHYSSSLESFLARGKTLSDFLLRQPPPSEILQESWDATWWYPAMMERIGINKTEFLTVKLRKWALDNHAQAYGVTWNSTVLS